MDCKKDERECYCLSEILRRIIMLQRQDYDDDTHTGCDKPYLGPTCTSICYNTRPIMLYNCCTGTPWSFEYGTTGATSNVFRVESLDECCCTCRILAPSTTTEDGYISTGEFFTINLECVGALKCLADTYVELC